MILNTCKEGVKINEGSSISWITIITAFIAIYGAVLSTLQMWWKRHPRLKVSTGPSILSSDIPSAVYIRVENHGEKPVNLLIPKFKIEEDGRSLYVSPTAFRPNISFPYTLQSGQSFMIHAPMETIISLLETYGYSDETEIFAVLKSEIGREFKSKYKIKMSDMRIFKERMINKQIADDVQGIF